MNAWLIAHDGLVKLIVMVTLLAVLAWLQWRWPLRGDGRHWHRWLTNLGLITTSTVLLRLIVPVSAATFAVLIRDSNFGLLNRFSLGAGVEAATAVVVLDFAIYWQHRAFHCFRWLWRVHRVHHSDLGFDASLGLRFHPFEVVVSMAYKFVVIAALGAAPMAVVVYETMLLGFSLMTHGDLAVPAAWDRVLRVVFVTPDWHRVHHSVHRAETNINFGNILSVWDRLLGTYRAQPRDGHREMAIGLREFREGPAQSLISLLWQPFCSVTPSPATPPDHPHA